MKRIYARLLRNARGERRRGAAMVEFAVVAPLLITFLFGIMEFGHVFKVRLTAQQAAREACRLAVLQSTQKPYAAAGGPVATKVSTIMTGAGVAYNAGMLNIVSDTTADPTVTVTITLNYSTIKLTGFLSPFVSTIRGTCSMRKEGV
jgi:Flp pilus assembly protein TadG